MFDLALRAVVRKIEARQQESVILAWRIAAFQRAAKFPKLSDVVDRTKRRDRRRAQTSAEIEVVMKRWRFVMASAEAQKGGR